jgi:hypothetical protein
MCETGRGQKVAQLLDSYVMMIIIIFVMKLFGTMATWHQGFL